MDGYQNPCNPDLGARNLLENCIGVAPGEQVLIVTEEAGGVHYDGRIAGYVADAARGLGTEVRVVSSELPETPGDFPPELREAMGASDHTVFLSRIADHARFIKIEGASTKTICYALDEGLLGSAYATVPHKLMSVLLEKIEAELGAAKHWRITCPLGTNVEGGFDWKGDEDEDFTFHLFPVTTFKPVPCTSMRGKVALAHWLIPGGKANYEPAFLSIGEPVMAHVDKGRLEALEGPPAAVAPVEAHRQMVAEKFGIDRDFVHSWHVGLNPHTFYEGRADADLERWGAVSFASPRYLHFHTCGDYAPGEIAWSVFDPTVYVDGKPFWKDGVFVWLERKDNADLISHYPGADCLYHMRRDLGVDF